MMSIGNLELMVDDHGTLLLKSDAVLIEIRGFDSTTPLEVSERLCTFKMYTQGGAWVRVTTSQEYRQQMTGMVSSLWRGQGKAKKIGE